MAPRPFLALSTIETQHGIVIVRKHYAEKQRSWILIMDGPQPALRAVLRGWRPRSTTSTRTQLTPPVQITHAADLTLWWRELEPRLREKLATSNNALVQSGTSPPAQATYLTLGEVGSIVQREVEASVRPISAATYRAQWSSLVRRLPAKTRLADLTRERLQTLVGELAAEGLSSATIRNLAVALGRVLTRAVEDHVLPRNPLDRVRLPKTAPHPRFVLTRQQRDHLLLVAARDGRDIHLLIAIGLLAGLRRSELLNLTWPDIDFNERVLHVRSNATFTTKSGHDRSVPLCSELLTVLTRFRRPSGYVIKPSKVRPGPARWCFQRSFDRVVREAGFPTLLVHGMRHTMATLAARAGVSPMKLSAWLGHSASTGSSKVTAAYVHGLDVGYDGDIERAAAG